MGKGSGLLLSCPRLAPVALAFAASYTMSLQPMAVALRSLGAGRLSAWGGLAVRCREFSRTACAQHVQPVEEEAPAPSEAPSAGKARWQQELGAVRTDWT